MDPFGNCFMDKVEQWIYFPAVRNTQCVKILYSFEGSVISLKEAFSIKSVFRILSNIFEEVFFRK